MVSNIQIIHEKVFNYLRDYHPSLRFTLRLTNQKQRLSQGYWFLGNEYYLVFSFWTGMDWKNKTPNIYLLISHDEKMSLHFTAKDSGEKALFFQDMSLFLDMYKDAKGNPTWHKGYGLIKEEKNLIDTLERFLKIDKIKIDKYIEQVGMKEFSNKKTLFKSISENDFSKHIKKIETYRQKQNTVLDTKRLDKPCLRLENIYLKNIKIFGEVNLPLNDNNVICFIGENGSGKSTILRAIALGLTGVDNEAIDTQHSSLQKMLKIEKSILDSDSSRVYAEYAEIGEIRINYRLNENKNIGKPLKWLRNTAYKTAPNEPHKIFHDYQDTDKEYLNDIDNSNFLEYLVIGFSQNAMSNNGVKEPQNDNLNADIQKDLLSLINDKPQGHLNLFENWLKKLFIENLPAEDYKNLVKEIIEIIQEITSDNNLEINERLNKMTTSSILINTKDNSGGIPLNLVSQGYSNVIGWIGNFMVRLYETWIISENPQKATRFFEHPAVCLIDEIDTYLHPKWQRNILKTLSDRFPNTTFVVTTHSPLVVSRLSSNNLYIVKNNTVIPYQGFVEGRDDNSILQDVFDTEKRPKDFQEKLDDFYTNIEREEVEGAREILDELENKWGNLDTEIVRANLYFNDLLNENIER